MALTTTNRVIRGTDTAHTARLAPSCLWRVTWLPGRELTQSQAEAAMQIAEEAGRIPADCDPEVYDERFWSASTPWPPGSACPGPMR